MSMTYVAAYALAALSKPQPSKADVEAVCKSVGIAVNGADLDFVLETINGRSINELIAAGAAKMASAPAASAGGAAAPAAAAAGGAAPAAAKEEAPQEEEDDDMGFGLFD